MLKTYAAKPVLDLIGKYESGGDYNIVYGGIPARDRPARLTGMTIAQVIDWQRAVVNNGSPSSAAGKYQIIRKTLMGASGGAGIPWSRKFDADTQDALACHLLDGRGFQRFLDGQIDTDDMMIGLAKEWASFPVPYAMNGASRRLQAGQSYYAGDGLNKAHASVAEVETALAIARERYRSGATPDLPDQDPILPPADARTAKFAIVGLVIGVIIVLLKG